MCDLNVDVKDFLISDRSSVAISDHYFDRPLGSCVHDDLLLLLRRALFNMLLWLLSSVSESQAIRFSLCELVFQSRDSSDLLCSRFVVVVFDDTVSSKLLQSMRAAEQPYEMSCQR